MLVVTVCTHTGISIWCAFNLPYKVPCLTFYLIMSICHLFYACGSHMPCVRFTWDHVPVGILLQHPHGNNAVNVIMCQGSQSSCLEVVRMSAGNVCLFNHRLLLGQTNSSLWANTIGYTGSRVALGNVGWLKMFRFQKYLPNGAPLQWPKFVFGM